MKAGTSFLSLLYRQFKQLFESGMFHVLLVLKDFIVKIICNMICNDWLI